MRCFQIVKNVLDDLYCHIPADSEAEKDNLIKLELKQLSYYYKRGVLEINDEGIDYSDIVTRFAYLYGYVTSHANMVFNLIEMYPILSDLFEADELNVSCIGGGPGSDILGILKYMEVKRKSPYLNCGLYDREALWGEAWNDLGRKVDRTHHINVFVQPLDVTDTKSIKYHKLFNADLFTMIYFLSEIYAQRDQACAFFEHMFSKMKTGAKILFIDNGGVRFPSWFDELIEPYGIHCIEEQIAFSYRMDIEEEKKDLQPYYGKFWDPKLKATISYRICSKQ